MDIEKNTNTEDLLEKLHVHINELLKISEAKNAGLLAFNGFILLEAFKNLYEHSIPVWQVVIIVYIATFNGVSFITCLSALIPSNQVKVAAHKRKNTINLLYFGTIASLMPTDYFHQFQERYETIARNKSYCIDLIRQIIIQSQILVGKFSKFKRAGLFTFCAFVSPLGYFIYMRLININEQIDHQ